MENLLDPTKYNRIHSIALNKSAWLIANETEYDEKGIVSFLALSKIITGEDEDVIGRIFEAYSTISDANQDKRVYAYVRGQRYAVSLTDVIWGRMCVIAYYFYHADPIWKDMGGHDKMLSMIKNTSILKAVNDCIVLIDNYYSDVEAIKQKKTQKTSLTPQPISHNNMPDVIQNVQDINAGKIAYTDIDWELQIKTILKLINLMPTHFSNVIWLWGFLAEIDDINKRIDILHKMQEVATKCFEDLFLASDFIKDCDCLIYVYQGSLQYNTKNIGLRHYWTDDKKHLNDLAHILCKEMVDPKFMVAMAEEMYCTIPDSQRKHPMLELVLHASRNIDKLTMTNIVDFAKNLYIAEGFRHLILSGEEDYMDIPALADFEPKLLKACFEEYIRLRTIDIKDIIEQDLTHCGDAEELECLEYLLDEESQHVNSENMLEDFRGSAAYNAMWYPGKQKVLDMINVFVEYLKNKIKKLKKEEAKLGIRDNIQNFNVQGDYIAGDKHVGAHIDNVSPGAIGAQTTKD